MMYNLSPSLKVFVEGKKKLNNSRVIVVVVFLDPAPANILNLRPVAPAFIHHKARATPYPQCAEKRFPVPDDQVPWEVIP